MEEMKCTYDAFIFSPRARLLRRVLLLLAHPLTMTLPTALLIASVTAPDPASAAAAGILLGFLLILVRSFRTVLLSRLDTLARRDAKALRLTDPQRYATIRHQQFPHPMF